MPTKFAPAERGIYPKRDAFGHTPASWDGEHWCGAEGARLLHQDGEWLCEPGVWALSGGERPELPDNECPGRIRFIDGEEMELFSLHSACDHWDGVVAFRLAPSAAAMGNAAQFCAHEWIIQPLTGELGCSICGEAESGSGVEGHALEASGKNHSTVRVCPKVENRKVPSGTTESANGDGCRSRAGVESGLPVSAAPLADRAMACRSDGRCQYAIDHGAEGLGACPSGKCCMPINAAGTIESLTEAIDQWEATVRPQGDKAASHPIRDRSMECNCGGENDYGQHGVCCNISLAQNDQRERRQAAPNAGASGTSPDLSHPSPRRDRFGLKFPAEVRPPKVHSIAANFWREWK